MPLLLPTAEELRAMFVAWGDAHPEWRKKVFASGPNFHLPPATLRECFGWCAEQGMIPPQVAKDVARQIALQQQVDSFNPNLN
jgi:hypothetical protein